MYDIGAEAFPDTLYDKIRAVSPNAVIINCYGSTETTISCIVKELMVNGKITIGRPAANVKAYVMDRAHQDTCGEMVICGKGVGRGYISLPEKNAAAFFEYEGERTYCSGDLVRYTDEGEIEFFGRLSHPTPRELARFISGKTVSSDNNSETIFNYEEIAPLLSANDMEHIDAVGKRQLGDIILTGATGFLGQHMLHEFLTKYKGKVYYLMRRGKYESCEQRLQNISHYSLTVNTRSILETDFSVLREI